MDLEKSKSIFLYKTHSKIGADKYSLEVGILFKIMVIVMLIIIFKWFIF